MSEERVTLDVNYNSFNDEDQLTIAPSGTITLRNSDAQDTVVKVIITDLPAGYTANAISDVTVPANGSFNVPFTINVPHKRSSGESNIGNIVIRDANNAEVDRAALVQKTKSMLELRELEVEYTDKDGKSQTDSFGESETDFNLDEKVQIGSEVTLNFRVKNIFNRNYDNDKSVIEEITLNIEPDDSGIVGDNFDEEYDLADLDANEDQTFTVSFTVPEDADAQDYTFDITIEGDDGEGFRHTITRELVVEVSRDRDDVRITKSQILPERITKCDASFTLDFEIKNYGTREQKYAGILIQSPQLGIKESLNNINIKEYDDDENKWGRTYTFNLPAGIRGGTYPLDLFVYIDRDELIHTTHVNVEIANACAAQNVQENEPATQPPATTTTPPPSATTGTATGSQPTSTQPSAGTTAPPATTGGTTAGSTTSVVLKTIENPYTLEDLFVGLIIALVVFIIALIVIFGILLIR